MLPYKINLYRSPRNKYALLIPTLNEGEYIRRQFLRMKKSGIFSIVDIFILDSDSSDGSVNDDYLISLGVTAKLVITSGKQGTAFRCGFYEVNKNGYKGVITVDGNNKDSIEDIPKFIEALDAGFDFIQGSRFTKGGVHENTPLVRLIANKMILIPWIRFLSHYHYTEVASAYRGISMRFLNDVTMDIGRDCFIGYELLWYMSVMAPRLGYKVTEIPVRRIYPKGPTPTKITCSRCFGIIFQLLNITLGKYNRKI